MVARVQKIAEGYAIVLTAEALAELKLVEGSAVEIRPAEVVNGVGPEIRYAGEGETLEAFERTLPRHEAAYRELAK